MRLLLTLILAMIFTFFLSGCSNQDDLGDMPAVLKVGVVPGENIEVLKKRYTPLLKYLSKELDVPYEFKITKSYEDLLTQFEQKSIDLAYFGGFTFIQAFHQSNAMPLVMRDVDINFTSYFIAKGNSPSNDITHFKAKSFSFGSRLSTSGHLMPRYFMQQKEIIPETFFGKVKYSGSHDKTAYWVRDGFVDIGVANAKIIDRMLLDGRLKQDDITILSETPPYPDYVWALQSGYRQSVQTKIRNAFLSLNPSNNEHNEILTGVDAGGFIPASFDDFIKIDDVATESGLLEGKTED